MKISAKQLDTVLFKLKHAMLGYGKDDQDLEIEVSITKEDPGNGVMTDCLTLEATKPILKEEDESGETKMSVEIYPVSEKLDPIASKTESFKITKKY